MVVLRVVGGGGGGLRLGGSKMFLTKFQTSPRNASLSLKQINDVIGCCGYLILGEV